jgi:hypothetical protein
MMVADISKMTCSWLLVGLALGCYVSRLSQHRFFFLMMTGSWSLVGLALEVLQ